MADNQNEFVCNEVLCYTQFYRNRSSVDKLKKVALNCYISDEIAAAKDISWYSCLKLGEKLVCHDV